MDSILRSSSRAVSEGPSQPTARGGLRRKWRIRAPHIRPKPRRCDERNQHSGREGREDDEVGRKRTESPHALTLRSRRVWLQINDQATTTNSESNQRKF